MSDLSKITLPNGTTYDLKDPIARTIPGSMTPLLSKTFNSVIISENADPGGYYYFFKLTPNAYNGMWYVRYKVTAEIDGVAESNGHGREVSYVYICGTRDIYLDYQTWNNIEYTSYRPHYGHLLYRLKYAGVTAGYGHQFGLRFQSAYFNGTVTSAANARTITFDILECSGGEVTFNESPLLYSELPGTGTTNYYTRDLFSGVDQGNTMTGDRNDTMLIQDQYGRFLAGANGLKMYSVFMQDANGTYSSFFTSAGGTGSSKTKNTVGFRLGNIYYYSPGSDRGANTYTANNQVYHIYNLIDLRYSFNISGTNVLTPGNFYIVGTLGSDGFFYLDNQWWTQTVPTTEDGKIYLLLGNVYYETNSSGTQTNAYRVGFKGWRGAYWYKNGQFQLMVPDSLNAVNAETVGGMSSDDFVHKSGDTVTGDLNVEGVLTAIDETYLDSATVGNLLVNGSARFVNTINGNAKTADKVNNQLKIQLNSGTTEGTNQYTYDGSAAKNLNITKSSVGLGNVENKSSATIRGELTKSNVTTALGYTPYTPAEVDALVSAVFHYKGTKATFSEVQALTGMKTGDVWQVTADNSEYVYNGTTWEKLGPTIDLSGYLTSVSIAGQTLTPSSNSITVAQLKTALGLKAAAYVDTESTLANDSKLPTGAAVKSFVEGKGYVTTDTKNTAGSTDTSSKIFLIGATSQAANPQTYSDNEVYATSGVLTTKSTQVGGGAVTMQYNATTDALDFIFA